MAIKYLNALAINGNGGTVLDVQGSQGQLFSVTDSLTGDIFAVSDISGVPILKVNSSGAVNIDGTLTSSGNITGLRLRVGDGTDGYFYSDTAGRTAFAGGQFYIQDTVGTYYNYATNQYHGNSSGDNHYFRGNPLSGDNWSITVAGVITAITFSGDLNGTINTATTGVTQTAGDNSTKIATTAYVDVLADDDITALAFTGTTTQTLTATQRDSGTLTASFNINKTEAGGTGPSTENLNTVGNNVTVGQMEYRGFSSSSSNGPPTSDNANGVISVGQHSGNYGAQLAFSSNGNMYWRDNPSTSFGSWRTMWDSGNDGAGSGLDADLLDGQQGSYYATAASLGNYLPLAGGTMTGSIAMSNQNITGVNQLTINDPGEGIVFTGTTNVNLYVIDDTTDSIVNFDNASEIRRNGIRVADVPYIASRSQQLMTNYNGLLGNNYNFPGWTFDGQEANYSPGSFKFAGSSGNSYTSEYMAVDTAYKYKMSLDAKTLNGVGRYYCMTLCYDVDQNQINAQHHMYRANTSTTLAVALNPGDTTVTLAGTGANWYDGGTAGVSTHLRSLIIWEYTNSLGYTYPPETYSRLWYSNVWDPNSINGNVITLRTAWTGPSYPVGTQLSNGSAGGSYKYNVMSNKLLTTDWTQSVGFMDGVDLSGTNVSTKFPPGTAKIRMGFLPNYNSGSTGADTIWITNFNVGIDTVLTKGDQSIAGTKTFTTVPVVGTIATADDSTSAASTAWVKDQGYVTGSYLPLAGGTMANTTLVTNMNADLLDGQEGSYYLDYANFTGTPTIPTVGDGEINGATSGLGITGSMSATANQAGDTTFTVTSNAATAATASTIAYRDSAADLNVRLLRANYANQNSISGAMAFRVNNGTDNYTRYCSSSSAIRTFLGVPASGDLGDYLPLAGGTMAGTITMNNNRITSIEELRFNNGGNISNQINTDIDSAAAEVVAQVSITDYTAAFFDFVVKKGTNVRSGTVYACHDGTNVEFTETSTNDLGDTSDVTLSVDKTSTNLRLIATVASNDWSVKSLIRAI